MDGVDLVMEKTPDLGMILPATEEKLPVISESNVATSKYEAQIRWVFSPSREGRTHLWLVGFSAKIEQQFATLAGRWPEKKVKQRRRTKKTGSYISPTAKKKRNRGGNSECADIETERGLFWPEQINRLMVGWWCVGRAMTVAVRASCVRCYGM
ncbi:hypothetical protein ACLOJK_035115 [Asimina triloba]